MSKRFRKRLNSLLSEKAAQGAMEYAMVVFTVMLVATASFYSLASAVSQVLAQASARLNGYVR